MKLHRYMRIDWNRVVYSKMMLYLCWLVGTACCLITTVQCQTQQYQPQDCKLTQPGVEYAGTISVTVSGYTCQEWIVDSPHDNYFKSSSRFPEGSAAHARNYCRNPDPTWGGGVWCYTTDTRMRWEICNVSFCECKVDEAGELYQGQVSTTVNRRICQAWASQSPHPHPFTEATMFVDNSMAVVSNTCRNPFAAYRPGGPWCYTTDPQVKWEYCDIDYCKFPNSSMSTLFTIVKNDSLEAVENTTEAMTTIYTTIVDANSTDSVLTVDTNTAESLPTVDTNTTESVAIVDTNGTGTVTTAILDTVKPSPSLNVTFQRTREISDARTTLFEEGSTQVSRGEAVTSTGVHVPTSVSLEFEELVDEISVTSLIIIIIAAVLIVIVVIVLTVKVWRKTRSNPRKKERESYDNPSYGRSTDHLQADQGAAVSLTNLSPDPAV